MLKITILALMVGLCQNLSALELTVDQRLPQILPDLEKLAAVKLSSSSPLHKKFFVPSLSGKAYLDWLDRRVRKIELDPDPAACGNFTLAQACVADDLSKYPGTIFVFNPEFDLLPPAWEWVQADIPETEKPSQWIRRVAMLIHESRHLPDKHGQGPYPLGTDHVLCPGAHAEPLCDDTVSGAYGFEVVFLLNIARFCVEGCTVQDKEIARRLADSILKDKLDPASRREILEDSNLK